MFSKDWHRDDRVNPLVRQYQVALESVLRNHPRLEGCAVTCCHCGIQFLTHPRNARRIDLRCPFGCRLHHRRQRGNARSRKHNQTDKGRANKKKLNIAARIKAGQAALSDTVARPLEQSVCAHSAKRVSFPSCLQDRKQSNQLTADSPSTHFAGAAKMDESPSVDKSQTVAESRSVDTSQTVAESRSVDKSPASLEHLTLNLNGFVLDERALVNSRILPYVRMVASVLECRTIRREELIAALLKSMRQRSMAAAPRREYVLRYLNEHPP